MVNYEIHEEIKNQFFKKFPKLFKNTHPFSFDLPLGWVKIAQKLFEELDTFNLEILQVKQKLGGFRVYVERESLRGIPESGQAHIHALIQTASEKASETCEWCGDVPATLLDEGYISNSCESCKLKPRNKR